MNKNHNNQYFMFYLCCLLKLCEMEFEITGGDFHCGQAVVEAPQGYSSALTLTHLDRPGVRATHLGISPYETLCRATKDLAVSLVCLGQLGYNAKRH